MILSLHKKLRRTRSGFTIVEILMVVMIIMLLAIIIIPNLQRARKTVRKNRFINDIRIATASFEQYALTTASYPAEAAAGVVPVGMDDYLKSFKWTLPTSIGGQWDWDNNQYGFKAGVSVNQPGLSDADMTKIDQEIDDGDITSGIFRKHAGGYISIIEQ